jgi:hypothetical protein
MPNENYEVFQGSSLPIPATICDSTGTPIAYAGSEALATTLWPGGNRSASYSVPTSWTTPASGLILISIPSADTAALAPGKYRLLTRVTVPGFDPQDAYECSVEVKAFAGTVAAPPTYCAYDDMLEFAPWVAAVADADADETGFEAQRAQARRDIDEAVISNYRGSSIGLFGSQSLAAMDWAGGGPRRTTRPSQVIRDYLAAGYLMSGRDPAAADYRPKVAKMAAYRAIAIVGLKQMAINQQHAAFGAMFHKMFLAEMSTFVAELDINGDGLCEIPIPLVASNSIFT